MGPLLERQLCDMHVFPAPYMSLHRVTYAIYAMTYMGYIYGPII